MLHGMRRMPRFAVWALAIGAALLAVAFAVQGQFGVLQPSAELAQFYGAFGIIIPAVCFPVSLLALGAGIGAMIQAAVAAPRSGGRTDAVADHDEHARGGKAPRGRPCASVADEHP